MERAISVGNRSSSGVIHRGVCGGGEKTPYRIHYRDNFKTVEQIAVAALENMESIARIPTTNFDFGLREYGDCAEIFEDFEEVRKDECDDRGGEGDEFDDQLLKHAERMV